MKKPLKAVSFIIAAVLLIGAIPAAVSSSGALPFRDVAEDDWYYDDVKYVYENGLMIGTAENVFSPDLQLSRATFVTVLGRLAGATGGGSSPFTDTVAGAWYEKYVAWAYSLGIVEGYPDGTFRPNDPITREQVAAATDRFLTATGLRVVKSGGLFDFEDGDSVSDWAAGAVETASQIGLFIGDGDGLFNPKAATTRAEAAAVVERLAEAIGSAWQGYLPEPGEDPVVFGAKYLYENGSILAGGMKRGLDLAGEFPILTLEMDDVAAYSTYLFPNTTGISINYGEVDVNALPVVKICYSFDGMDEAVPGAVWNVNVTRAESAGYREDIPVTAGDDEDGMKTATLDLTATLASHSIDFKTQLCNLLFTPCAEDYDGDGKFTVKYIGFFASREDADAFGAESDPEICDYLLNYALGFKADVRDYTDTDKEYYDKLLVDRIAEIKNSPSELTPADVYARGGKCYFISSVNGDDSNDGLSPETPWRSLSKLVRIRGSARIPVPKKGDGVFFERGSVFYPEHYRNSSICALDGVSGVDYGAYGEGPKPVITCALDFMESGGVGDWQPTEYENVWCIPMIDDSVTIAEDDEGNEFEAAWYGERSEIANIFFDGGRAVGLRIVAKGDRQTLGDGIVSYEKGRYFNGLEYYYSEERSLENPGTALLHNLEFFHDFETGSLYLYWDRGNPADSFGDIKAGRKGTGAVFGSDTVIDSLALVYSGMCCAEAGGKNVTVQNCEIGCVFGLISSDESGFFVWNSSDGVTVKDCYIHDVGDGALTSQGGGAPGSPNQIHNVRYIDNVMVACGNGAEIWNHMSDIDEDGVSASKITDCLIRGNIIAYNGYGPRLKQDTGSFHGGETICGSMYGEFVNSRIEDNIFLYGVGELYYAYMATYSQPRGWESYGNTYVFDPEIYLLGYSYETLNYLNHGMWKRARIAFPFTGEGIDWYCSLGIDPKGVFYRCESDEPYKQLNGSGYFFMTGYYAERGENPSKNAG